MFSNEIFVCRYKTISQTVRIVIQFVKILCQNFIIDHVYFHCDNFYKFNNQYNTFR